MIMEIDLVIKSIMGLVAILAFLMLLLFLPSSKKKSKKQKTVKKVIKEETKTAVNPPINTDIKHLRDIIKNKKSKARELQETLDLVIKYHGNIHKKLGIRAHPDFDTYEDILFTICRHPNANKDMIIKFDKELAGLNENYKKDINEAITKGLNSRRV